MRQELYFDLIAESLVDEIISAPSVKEGEKILSDQLYYVYTMGVSQGINDCLSKLELLKVSKK